MLSGLPAHPPPACIERDNEMKWSWRIGRIAGIDVHLHATFGLLLAYFAWHYYSIQGRWQDALSGMFFIAVVFFIVVLHELGHALAARRFGIQTHDITLLPIGGVARLERMPENPWQELVVALAGPAVNIALAGILFLVLLPTLTLQMLGRIYNVGETMLFNLLVWNLFMAAFNLIPAFPMDGGRVLRALLAMRMGLQRATVVAARVGQGLAVMFFLVALFVPSMWTLLLIAFFVWIGAENESDMVQLKHSLAGIPIRRVMITDYRTLSPMDPLSAAVDHILAGFQQDFPVVENGRVIGMLTRGDLIAAIASKSMSTPVGDVMRREFSTALPHETATDAFARLQSCDCRSLPVVQDGAIMGIVTVENVGEFLMIQDAVSRRVPPMIRR
jgi:Zn-dependent protease